MSEWVVVPLDVGDRFWWHQLELFAPVERDGVVRAEGFVASCAACGAAYTTRGFRALPLVATRPAGRHAFAQERRCPCGAPLWVDLSEVVAHVRYPRYKAPPERPLDNALYAIVHAVREGGAAPFELVVELAGLAADADPVATAWGAAANPEHLIQALGLADEATGWHALAVFAAVAGLPEGPNLREHEPFRQYAHHLAGYASGAGEYSPCERAYLCAAIRVAFAPPTLAALAAGAVRATQ